VPFVLFVVFYYFLCRVNPDLFFLLVLFYVQVQFVQEAVDDRGHENAGDHQEQYARKQGVERSEKFSAGRGQRIDRPHAAQDHGGVKQGIDPGQPFQDVISQDANPQRRGNHPACNQAVQREAADENFLDSSGSR
jgi:hypothetical protein